MANKRNKTVGNEGYRTARYRMLTATLYTLKQMGRSDELVRDFYDRFMYNAGSIVRGYLSYEDMARALKDENDIEVTFDV